MWSHEKHGAYSIEVDNDYMQGMGLTVNTPQKSLPNGQHALSQMAAQVTCVNAITLWDAFVSVLQ